MIYGWKDQRINVTKLSKSQNESSGGGGGGEGIWFSHVLILLWKWTQRMLEYLQWK